MKRLLVIDATGLVINIVVVEEDSNDWQPPSGCTVELATPGVGMNWVKQGDGSFVPPQEE